MKQLFTLKWLGILLCLIQLSGFGFGQQNILMTNTLVTSSSNATSNGYYLYLPQGYDASQKYPIIISFHGLGENGNGGSQLVNVENNGMPGWFSKSTFPTSFTVNGSTFKFIVFAPQFTSSPEYYDVDAAINYALAHYPVDLNRVYVTGYSQGGGNIWYYGGINSSYANKIAALVPVEGSVDISAAMGQTIASAKLPVFTAVNAGDSYYYGVTINNVNNVNSATNPAPAPPPYLKVFQASAHDGWDSTYNPAVTFNGLNVYQWMLQFTRATTALPVVLGSYTAQLTGPSAVTISWTTTAEVNNKSFQIERSADGLVFTSIGTVTATNDPTGHAYSFIDQAPLKGNNYYRLSQTDLDGHVTYFSVLNVTVTSSLTQGLRMSPNPVSGSIQLILTHPEMGPLSVALYDIQGRMLRSWQFDKERQVWQQTIDVGTIAPGAYTIQIKGNTIREVRQFVKQ